MAASTSTTASGPVAYWKFDEYTGTFAYDSSGYGNIGSIYGGATRITGKVGNALIFDGVNDYVDAGNNPSLQITGAISMAGWVKINNLSVNSGLFGRGHGLGAQNNYGYFLTYYAPTKALYFDTYSTSNRDILSKTNAINDNNWHYIVVTWDGTKSSNGKKMYIDGVLVAQKASSILSMGNPSYNFRIGRDSNGNRPAKASIDEVKVYNRALSAAEVIDASNVGTISTPTSTPPVTSTPPSSSNSLKLTIDRAKISSPLADFPILVHLGTSSGISIADTSAVFTALGSDANRKKISITDSNGKELYVEIEKWDTASKQAWLWIKVPTISSTADTVLYLNYDINRMDNTAYVGDIGSTPARNVWSNGFVSVNHLDESGTGTTSDFKDSTIRGHNGQNFGATRVDGKIGYAQNFDGVNDYITIPDSDDFSITNTCGFTVSIWYNPNVENMVYNTGGYVRWLAKGYGSGNWEYHILTHNQDGSAHRLRWYNYGSSGGLGAGDYSTDDTLPVGTWKHITAVSTCTSSTSGNEWLYVDGAHTGIPQTWQTYGLNYQNGPAPLNLGMRSASAPDRFNGKLDELRVSNVSRSLAWIKADYYSQADALITFASVP